MEEVERTVTNMFLIDVILSVLDLCDIERGIFACVFNVFKHK